VSYSECAGEVVPAPLENCYTKELEACGTRECVGFAAWSFSFGSDGNEYPTAMAAAADGGAVLVSAFDDVGGARDGRLDRIDPNGKIAAPTMFEGAGDQYFTAVANRDSEVVVAGYFDTAIDLGDGSTPTQGETDAFVGVFDSTLMTLRDKLTFGSGSNETIGSLAVSPMGYVAIGGGCQGDFTIETTAVPAPSGVPSSRCSSRRSRRSGA